MRSARIFLTGVGGLVALFTIVTYPRQAVVAGAASIGLLVVLGFCIPVPPWIISVESGFWQSHDRAVANPFPSFIAFETEVRNLWLLILSPLYAMGVAAVALGRYDERWQDTPFNSIAMLFSIKVGQWITVAAVYFAWWWFQERRLLRRAEAGVGFAPASMGDYGVAYQYYDPTGERRAATSYAWGIVTPEFPVFMHAANPDFSKPGFGFMFHRFAVVDGKEVPSAVLTAARQSLLIRSSERI